MSERTLTPQEVEDFLWETFEMDTQFWIEEETDMTQETENALFQAVLYLLQARSFEVAGEAKAEAVGYIERLQTAYYAPPPPDPFAEPSDDPPAGAPMEHCGTVTLAELDGLFAE